MRLRADFSLFKRTLPSGKRVYYYYIYDDFGKRKQFSAGLTVKKKAFNFCIELLKENNLLRTRIPTFKELTRDYFDYDICPIVRQKIIQGEKVSRSNIDTQRSFLINVFTPILGEMLISRITEETIESLIGKLIDEGYAPNSINYYISTLKNMFNYIHFKKLIRINPMSSNTCTAY